MFWMVTLLAVGVKLPVLELPSIFSLTKWAHPDCSWLYLICIPITRFYSIVFWCLMFQVITFIFIRLCFMDLDHIRTLIQPKNDTFIGSWFGFIRSVSFLASAAWVMSLFWFSYIFILFILMTWSTMVYVWLLLPSFLRTWSIFPNYFRVLMIS